MSLPSEMPIQNTGSNTANKIIIKILPTAPALPITLPVGVITNQTCENAEDAETESNSKAKKLRKIVPKIIIDKC